MIHRPVKNELDTRDGYKRSSIDSSWIIERQFVPFPLFLFVSAGHKELQDHHLVLYLGLL